MAHFFVSVCGSKIRNRVAHFFIDIHTIGDDEETFADTGFGIKPY